MEEPNILIKSALSDAVQKVNEGMTPSEALKKVAFDLDLNPNYIQRTGEALNVALHYKHFKTASDRSADFEIADIPKVIQDVFTVSEKTASEYVSEHFSGNESNDTVFNYNRILSNPVYKQAYLEIAQAKETQESYPTTLERVYEKSANYIQKLNKEAELADVSKISAEFDLNHKFSVLCDEFKKEASYRTSFEEFESQVFTKHGEAAVPYLDLLHKAAQIKEDRGVHDSKYVMFDVCKEAHMFDSLMSSATDYISTAKTAEEIHSNLSYEQAYLKEAHKLMGKQAEALQPNKIASSVENVDDSTGEEAEPTDPVLAEIKKKASDPEYAVAPSYSEDPVLKEAMEKEAFGFGRLFGDLLNEPLRDTVSSSFRRPVTKPNLTLDNMERKLLLQELMLTDPILSKHNPAKVARAFEQLLRLSPELSKEKEVVRAELRAMMASQALSKFDADLMTKLDTGMLKRRVATMEFNKGEHQNFRL